MLRLPGGIVAPPPKAHAGPAKKRSVLPIVAGVLALLVIVGGGLAFALSRRQAPAAAATPTIESAVAGVTEVVAWATRPTADLAGGGVQVATVAPATEQATAGAAAATLPVVSAAETVTATGEISSTATVSGTLPGEPTVIPTFTAIPTRTPLPTRAPEPTATRATATVVPTQPITSGVSRGVVLLRPAEGEKIIGEAEFSWREEPGFFLKSSEAYELIIWGVGEDPMRDGQSPVGETIITSTRANLTGVESALGLTAGKTYPWGIRLLANGTPKRMVSDGRLFVYERAQTGGGGGGDTGSGCTGHFVLEHRKELSTDDHPAQKK